MRTLLLASMLLAVPVAAQDIPDAGLPDASVGSGGADQGSEENDPNATACLSSNDCTSGYTCVKSRCTPAPVRNATGCGAVPGALWLGAAALGLLRRRRR